MVCVLYKHTDYLQSIITSPIRIDFVEPQLSYCINKWIEFCQAEKFYVHLRNHINNKMTTEHSKYKHRLRYTSR